MFGLNFIELKLVSRDKYIDKNSKRQISQEYKNVFEKTQSTDERIIFNDE